MYLILYQISLVVFFCENNYQLVGINYFDKITPSYMFDGLLNKPTVNLIDLRIGD